jgi:hypothetical protein
MPAVCSRGDDGDRHDQREHDGGDDRQRDVAEELARLLLDGQHGDEHRRGGERRGEDRAPDLPAAPVRRVARAVPPLDPPVDVLEHDDRVVDDHPDREREPRERDDIERAPQRPEDHERGDDRDGNTGRDDDRGPAVPQEQQQDENGQTAADEQVRRHEIARGEDVVRLVVDDLQLDVAALVEAVQARDLGLQPLDHVDDVRAGPAQDAERDRRLAVLAEDEGALGVGIADLGHVFQVDGPPFAA